MKLLLLLSPLFYYVNAQHGSTVFSCLTGKETNTVCQFGKTLCSQENVPTTCPNLCGVCRKPQNDVKTTMTEVVCPANHPKVQGKEAHCWEATWNNDNKFGVKKSLVILYPYTDENLDDSLKKVAFSGVIDNDDTGSVFAAGDVEHGRGNVVFDITSKFTTDKRVDYNHIPNKMPIIPSLYKVVSDEDTEKNIDTRQIVSRDNVERRGYELSVRPVMDKRFYDKYQGNAKKKAMEAVELGAHAFRDPSIDLNIDIKVLEPVRFGQNVAPGLTGWKKVVDDFKNSDPNRYDFDGNSDDSTNSTLHLFFTKTPVLEVPNDFSLVTGRKGQICGSKPFRRFYVIEYFGRRETIQSVTRAIGMGIGMDPDYYNGTKVDPDPRTADGKNCTKVGGYMDIPLDANHWTRCSNEDALNAAQTGGLSCLRKRCYDRAFGCINYDKAQCATKLARKSCSETCGFCDHYNNTGCKDKNTVCLVKLGTEQATKKFLKDTICKNHPGYCPKACNMCGTSQKNKKKD